MKLLILAVSALLAAAILGVEVVSAQEGPPSVQPGTAAENCQRIVDEGYSPHDYIYSVLFFRQRLEHQGDPGIDYFHFKVDRFSLRLRSWVLGFSVGGLKATSEGLLYDFWVIHQEYVFTGEPGSYSASPRNGELLDIDGKHVRFSRRGLGTGRDQLLDAYRWRPTGAPSDGSGDIIYRDRQPTEAHHHPSFTETDWIHDPDWDGAEGARMSSIWGDVSACAG